MREIRRYGTVERHHGGRYYYQMSSGLRNWQTIALCGHGVAAYRGESQLSISPQFLFMHSSRDSHRNLASSEFRATPSQTLFHHAPNCELRRMDARLDVETCAQPTSSLVQNSVPE